MSRGRGEFIPGFGELRPTPVENSGEVLLALPIRMNTGDGILVLLGVVLIAGAGYQEWSWRRRLKGKRCAGRIVASRDVGRADETEFYPMVEYDFEGETRRFTSKYGSSTRPRIETSVVVVVAPETGDAEVLNTSNRLVGTLALLGIGLVVLLAVAFGY